MMINPSLTLKQRLQGLIETALVSLASSQWDAANLALIERLANSSLILEVYRAGLMIMCASELTQNCKPSQIYMKLSYQ